MFTFVPYLFVVLVAEVAANIMYHSYGLSTEWIYNILSLFSHLFYSFIFYKFSTLKGVKKTILVIILSFTLLSIGNTMYSSTSLNHYVMATGSVIQVIFSCLFLYEYLNHDHYQDEKHYISGLCIASGVLIFYAGVTIVLSLYPYIRSRNLTLFDVPLINLIPRLLSVVLYSCLSAAFILWKRPTTK